MEKKKTILLLELVQLLESLLPKQETHNPHSLLQEPTIQNHYYYQNHEADVQRLYSSLVHYLTILNHLYRVEIKGIYQSSREDNLLALYLLKENLTTAYLSQGHQSTYYDLMDYYSTDQAFTSREAKKLLQLPHTTLNRHLKVLKEQGYLAIVGGSKNKGYHYQLIDRLAIQHPIPFSFSSESQETSMFQEGMPEVQVRYPIN